jgi:hypothetical protein
MGWAASSNAEIVLPNYYLGLYECDVYKVSAAGHTTEYEIKTSRADFKRDFAKAHQKGTGQYETEQTKHGYMLTRQVYESQTKHDRIREGGRVSRFYFVVPEGMVTLDDVPADFGLIYATGYLDYRGKTGVKFEIKRTSKLHKKQPLAPTDYIRLARLLSLKLRYAKQ